MTKPKRVVPNVNLHYKHTLLVYRRQPCLPAISRDDNGLSSNTSTGATERHLQYTLTCRAQIALLLVLSAEIEDLPVLTTACNDKTVIYQNLNSFYLIISYWICW